MNKKKALAVRWRYVVHGLDEQTGNARCMHPKTGRSTFETLRDAEDTLDWFASQHLEDSFGIFDVVTGALIRV